MSWGFCLADDVERELGPSVRVPAEVEIAEIINQRAAHIRAVLATRGVTALESWEHDSDREDTWQILKLANIKGAAADVLASVFGLQDSERVSVLAEDYGSPSSVGVPATGLMAQVEQISLPGVVEEGGTQAVGSSSYATNNPTDDTNDPAVTRDLEF